MRFSAPITLGRPIDYSAIGRQGIQEDMMNDVFLNTQQRAATDRIQTQGQELEERAGIWADAQASAAQDQANAGPPGAAMNAVGGLDWKNILNKGPTFGDFGTGHSTQYSNLFGENPVPFDSGIDIGTFDKPYKTRFAGDAWEA